MHPHTAEPDEYSTQHRPMAEGDARRGDLPESERSWTDLLACAFVTLCWILPIAFIGIYGEFPLSDDFAYARAVQVLHEEARLVRVDWTYIPLLTHTLIGGAFTYVFGYSFENLRLIGIIMGWLGMMATYALCRRAGAKPTLATFLVLLVAFNPLYLNLSYSYMTDVPFAALVAFSLLALDRAIRTESWSWFLVGLLLAVAATLCRQLGLMICFGYAAAVLLARPRTFKAWFTASVFVAVNGWAYAYVPLLVYGNQVGSVTTDTFLAASAVSSSEFLTRRLISVARLAIYTGLFFAPVSGFLLRDALRQRRRGTLAAFAVVAAAIASLLLASRIRLPGRNVINDIGLGPIIMSGDDLLPSLPAIFWWAATMFGAASLSILLVAALIFLFRERRRLRNDPLLPLLAISAAAYGPGMLVGGMDRYLVPLLPLAAALAAALLRQVPDVQRSWHPAGVAFLLILAAFSVCGTRDYMQRHRMRADVLASILRDGATPDRISGGFEFNAWHNHRDSRTRRLKWRKGPWVIDDEWIVSFQPAIDGYILISERQYQLLIPPSTETIRVFRRSPASTPQDAPSALRPLPQRDPRPSESPHTPHAPQHS